MILQILYLDFPRILSLLEKSGDRYRLAFLASTSSSANSSDIEDYNRIFDDLAETVPELAALKQDWKVIGSTETVDARTNTSTDPVVAKGVPIFLLDGKKLSVVSHRFCDWPARHNSK